MKPIFLFAGSRALVLAGSIVLGTLSATGPIARADDAANSSTNAASANEDADKAWREVRKVTQPPMPPAEWQQHEPSQEEKAKFWTDALVKGADKAKDFYTRFPKHVKAGDARKIEYHLLTMAVMNFGDKSQAERLAALDKQKMDDPNTSEDERFQLRVDAVKRLMRGGPDNMAEIEKNIHALQKDFPKRDEVYQLMTMLLAQSEGDKAKALAQEIIDSPASDEIKNQAKGVLQRMEAVGKPLDIQYTALDGREVNISKMKGKVVLVDFWATWCGPCMGELPHVKEAYEKLHDKGFEIVGISFDQSKDALEKTLKEKEMTWPQYFDGAGWGNKFGQQFGINGIPTMWLVDKKGILRDVDGRDGLAEKVGKLLAEE
jgi:thiol-disulfide isomerase/thioredoxin